MKISFRLECPNCKWGYVWSDNYVNQGWLVLKCHHCDNNFYLKISIPTVNIETSIKEVSYPISRRFLKS